MKPETRNFVASINYKYVEMCSILQKHNFGVGRDLKYVPPEMYERLVVKCGEYQKLDVSDFEIEDRKVKRIVDVSETWKEIRKRLNVMPKRGFNAYKGYRITAAYKACEIDLKSVSLIASVVLFRDGGYLEYKWKSEIDTVCNNEEQIDIQKCEFSKTKGLIIAYFLLFELNQNGKILETVEKKYSEIWTDPFYDKEERKALETFVMETFFSILKSEIEKTQEYTVDLFGGYIKDMWTIINKDVMGEGK